MILIADSSALIALSIVNKIDVLEKLFDQVFVPKAVFEEISVNNKDESKQLYYYCKNRVVEIVSMIDFNVSLGKGESEAMVLYKEQNADLLLCDDKKAKKFARNFGINIIGSLGVLLKAKEKKLIPQIAPLITTLQNSKIFIDENTCNTVLKIANEL